MFEEKRLRGVFQAKKKAHKCLEVRKLDIFKALAEGNTIGGFCILALILFLRMGFPDSSVGKESTCGRPLFDSWVKKIPWRRDMLSAPIFLGFLCGSAGDGSTCNARDLGSISGLGRSPGEGKGYPIQYSGLENSTDCLVHGVAKSQTQLSDFHFTSFILQLE